MKQSIQVRLSHQLSMTPQLQQAIRLLQLSSLELKSELELLIQSNPLLELEEGHTDESLQLLTTNQQQTDSHNDVSDLIWPTHDDDFEHAHQNSKEATLKESLNAQLDLTPMNAWDRMIALAIIDAINEEGYLDCDLSEIAQTLSQVRAVNLQEINTVLNLIQQFEPTGIAARNLPECLRIQAKALLIPENIQNKLLILIDHHLELLAKQDLAALKRKMQITTEELAHLIAHLKSLHPRPGNTLNSKATNYVIPDLIVRRQDKHWVIELNPDCTPKLKLNQNYAELIRHVKKSFEREQLRKQFQEAKWITKSLENRNETLLKVAKCILANQLDFLEYGEEAMKPLILQDIASATNLNESTISRVTTQKYIYTSRGTFELKYFFSSHVGTKEGGECSATAIRSILKKLIKAENQLKPLSDNKLAKMLNEQGISVARRTVTKYREALGIPPSNERKRL